jgi:hypothetical protein
VSDDDRHSPGKSPRKALCERDEKAFWQEFRGVKFEPTNSAEQAYSSEAGVAMRLRGRESETKLMLVFLGFSKEHL